jgi:TolA-binding protein
VGISTTVVGTSKATLGTAGSGVAAGSFIGGGSKIVVSALVTLALVGGGTAAYQISTDTSAPPPRDGGLVKSKIPVTQAGTEPTPQSALPRLAAPQETAANKEVRESMPSPVVRIAEAQRASEAKPMESSSFVSERATRGAKPAKVEQVSTVAFPLDDAVQEARIIEAARQVLASNPAQALAFAQDHERQFPDGALSIERRVLLIEALFRLGRWAEATNSFEKFRKDHPSSAHLRRLEQISTRL